MKLSKFLAHYASDGVRGARMGKKEIKRLLAAGRVSVETQVQKDGQFEIGKFTEVTLDGKLLREQPSVYLMLNKPAGYLSATKDDQHPTVMDLLGGLQYEYEGLHIAGRLDRATTGLLILTNDGKWSRQLTEPKEVVPKVYLVNTAEQITEKTASQFEQGVYFAYEDITTQPAVLEIIHPQQAKLTIYEGKYHQVKRMFHAVGNRVTALHRVSVGKICLDSSLEEGCYRQLLANEL